LVFFCHAELTKVLVIGGYKEGAISNVEVIDLSGDGLTCPKIPDYPLKVDAITAGFYDEKVIVCGGYDNSRTHDECFYLGPDLSRWIEMAPVLGGPKRRLASSIIDNKWLLSGGYDGRTTFKSTFFFDGISFNEGPEMPASKRAHCQVSINATHIFFANGGTTTFLLNWYTQEYDILDRIPNSKEYGSCGVINNADHGLEVLLVDESSSYIYSIDDREWRDGPKLPQSTVDSFPVQLDDGFLSMGGKLGSSYHATIYKFDENAYDWLVEPVRLETPRQFAAAVTVPDTFLNCV